MSFPSGLLGFASRLCMPALGVLLAAIAGVIGRRSLRTSAHGALLCAQLVTMMAVELMEMLYLTKLLPCKVAAPIQSFFMLSVACWAQSLCLNMVYRLRNHNIENFAENFIGFFLSMLYSWISPFIILLIIDAILQPPTSENVIFLDSKTCILHYGAFKEKGEIDASVYISISKAVFMCVSAFIFGYLAYKIGTLKRGILLCAGDAGNMGDILRRQHQAMRFILLIIGSYALEIIADTGIWYTKHNQPRTHPEFPDQNLLAVEQIFKSFAFFVDFFRCIFACDIIWYKGPNRPVILEAYTPPQHTQRRISDDSLPGYEEAILESASTTGSPPSYYSLFGSFFNRNVDIQYNATTNCHDNNVIPESNATTNVHDNNAISENNARTNTHDNNVIRESNITNAFSHVNGNNYSFVAGEIRNNVNCSNSGFVDSNASTLRNNNRCDGFSFQLMDEDTDNSFNAMPFSDLIIEINLD